MAEHVRLSRRTFLALGATIVAGACSSDDSSSQPTEGATELPATTNSTTSPPTTDPPTTRPATSASSTTAAPTTTAVSLAENPFTLGVTAGDPDPTSAVLWTRLIGADLPDAVDVTWELADDPSFATTSAAGTATTQVADGYSVHAVVELEAPAWYRFRIGDWTSPVGRVAPAPAGAVDQLRVASASCQHWETGFYAAHRDIAEWAPDLVVFLGDFIYEGAGQPIAEGRVRAHDGAEPTDLGGYRARYAQYLSDPDLQAARAAAPVARHLGRPRGREQLRRPHPAGRSRRADVRGATGRRLPSLVGAHARAPPAARRPGSTRSIGHSAGAISPTSCCSTVASTAVTRPAARRPLSLDPPCPEALDPTRTMLGPAQEEWLGDPARRRDRDLDGARAADGAHRPPLRRGDPQLRPVGRLRAGPRSPARPGGVGGSGRRAHRRHPPRRRRRAPRSRRRVRHWLDLLVGPDRSGTAADPRFVRRRRGVGARPPWLHAAHGDAGDMDRRVPDRGRRASNPHRRSRPGARSASMPPLATS